MASGKRKARQRPRFDRVKATRSTNCPTTGKRSWHSHDTAIANAASLAKKARGPIRAYLCPFCGRWHLTSQPER